MICVSPLDTHVPAVFIYFLTLITHNAICQFSLSCHFISNTTPKVTCIFYFNMQ